MDNYHIIVYRDEYTNKPKFRFTKNLKKDKMADDSYLISVASNEEVIILTGYLNDLIEKKKIKIVGYE